MRYFGLFVIFCILGAQAFREDQRGRIRNNGVRDSMRKENQRSITASTACGSPTGLSCLLLVCVE